MTPQEIELVLSTGNSSKGTEDESGTGLGLRLTRDYLGYLHGELTLFSEKEKGTTFSVVVP